MLLLPPALPPSRALYPLLSSWGCFQPPSQPHLILPIILSSLACCHPPALPPCSSPLLFPSAALSSLHSPHRPAPAARRAPQRAPSPVPLVRCSAPWILLPLHEVSVAGWSQERLARSGQASPAVRSSAATVQARAAVCHKLHRSVCLSLHLAVLSSRHPNRKCSVAGVRSCAECRQHSAAGGAGGAVQKG